MSMEQMSHAMPVSVSAHYTLAPVEANEWPRRIFGLLCTHVGASHAIPAQSIADTLGFHSRDAARKVRIVVAMLIEEGWPIGAKANGFFWIESPVEAREYLKDLEKRVHAIWKRHKDFSRAVQKYFNIPYEQPHLL